MGDLAASTSAGARRKPAAFKVGDCRMRCARLAGSARKTGKGYYKYEAGSRAALPDPEVEKLIDETLQRLGRSAAWSLTTRSSSAYVPDDQRGRAHPEEGIAARPSDIDVNSGSMDLAGRSIAAGPMFYAIRWA